MNRINAVKIGNTINVSLNGKLYKKNCSTSEDANELYKTILEEKANPTEESIDKILGFMNEKSKVAIKYGEYGFEYNPNTGLVYLAGFSTPIPNNLIEVVKEYDENNYPIDAIVNFWKLLMLNPDKRIRESLFDFILTHDFVLTDKGYMIVYKAVDYMKKSETSDLAEYVTESYLHVKKHWKASPKKYIVYKSLDDNDYHITKSETFSKWDFKEKNVEEVGILEDLFNDIDILIDFASETIYTDIYSHTMSIRLGQPVMMDRKECDSDPAIDCSYGIHCGSATYVQSFANNNSAILVCLVNPAHVVAVPHYDHSKMRVSEYFPFAKATFENREIDIIDQPYFENDYSHYENNQLEEMLAKVLNEELPLPNALNVELDSGEENRSFEELQKIISSRIIDVISYE